MIFLNRLIAASRVVALYLLVAYLLLIGGQYYGLVVFQINVLSTILLIVIAIGWIGWRLKRKRGFAQTPLDLPIFIGLGAAAASALFSLDPSRSAGALFLGMVWAGVYWMAADGLSEGWSRRTLGRAVYLSGAVIAAVAFIQVVLFWRDWLSLGLLPQVSFRVAAPNPTAAFLNFIWTLWLAELIEAKKRWLRAMMIIALAISGVVMFYTSSRGGWIGTGVAILILLLAYRQTWWQVARRLYAHKVTRVFIVVGAVVAIPIAAWLMIQQVNHPTHGSFFESRSEFWPVAWESFLRSPLTGTGLFTYGSSYLPTLSVPPRGMFNQAHGLVFNLLAETGLLGIGAAIFAFIVFIKNVGQVVNLSYTESHWRVAALASLGAALAHSMFETIYVNPPVMALAAIATATLLPTISRSWRNGVMLIAVVVCAVWGVWAYEPLHRGIEVGNEGKWKESSQVLDEALKRDPFSTWAKLQAGYAAQRTNNYARAIQLYQESLKREPGYALNWANLAAAQWANGNRDEAKLTLARARVLAPDVTLFQVAESKWTGTPTPLIKLDEVEERIALVLTGKLPVDELTKDRERLAARFQNGEALSSEVIQLAEIEIARKNFSRAEYLLHYAVAMRGGDSIALEFAYGDLDAARGDVRLATEHYARAWELYYQPLLFGEGTAYGWLFFVRESFRENISPELNVAPMPNHIVARAELLAAWYRSVGEDDRAKKIESLIR